MPEPLTQLERRVYHYMIDFLAENTYQPSIREIAKKFRIKSTKTVSDLLHALANKGYIERDESRSRGVRLLGYAAAGATQPVPYYGKIHAGEPALLPELWVQYVDVAHWQRQWLQGDVLEAQLNYWRRQLGDQPPLLHVPTDRPRQALGDADGAFSGGNRFSHKSGRGSTRKPSS